MVTLFTPPGQDFLCIEHIYNVTDWMHLHLRQRGLPGERMAHVRRLAVHQRSNRTAA